MAPGLPQPTTDWLDAGEILRSRVPRLPRVLGQATLIGGGRVTSPEHGLRARLRASDLISPVHFHSADDDDWGALSSKSSPGSCKDIRNSALADHDVRAMAGKDQR